MRVVESGTGSGSLSVSLARAVLPTGRLFTYEFNADRVEKARVDFAKLGLAEPTCITVTHRDVLNGGFVLTKDEETIVGEGTIDAVFLDLPSPQIAVSHAHKILRRMGKLCNFSPCIEQVQAASYEMARLGFTNIKTIECLARELVVTKTTFTSLVPPPTPAREAGADTLPLAGDDKQAPPATEH